MPGRTPSRRSSLPSESELCEILYSCEVNIHTLCLKYDYNIHNQSIDFDLAVSSDVLILGVVMGVVMSVAYPLCIRYEIHFIKIGGMIRTLTTSFSYGVALTFYMAITFLIYVGTGGQLTPRRVIVTLSLLGFLRQISASFLIRSIFLIFESKVAFARIQVSKSCNVTFC